MEPGQPIYPVSEYREVEIYGGILYPGSPQYVGAIEDGSMIGVTWTKLGRRTAKRAYTATARVKSEDDEIRLRLEAAGALGSMH